MAEKGCRMDGIDLHPATGDERLQLFALMRGYFSGAQDRTLERMGLTWPQLEELYRTRGETRTIRCSGRSSGYLWIERSDRTLHIHGLFVLPHHQGQGIGTAALKLLEHEFRHEVEFLELGVHESNPRARALYDRLGFTVTKEMKELGFVVMRAAVAPRQPGGDGG
ncbi:MAG: GNAT family N-acetyltransferase [Candidatus Eisenbacteria bacterium]